MIDPRAVIDSAARLAEDVSVGAFTLIGPDVEIGAGTWIGPHAVINGPTRIGSENRIYQFTSIGEAPQDKKYAGEATRLEIGDRNTIREFVTVNRGTVQDAGITRIGDENWIMAYVHIAHDCLIGNQTIFSNNASLAGHVRVDDYAILGGFTLVHQFCAIGAHAFCAFGSSIKKDVPPFVIVDGSPARPRGLNAEGLKRRGFTTQAQQALRQAYKTLYRSNLSLQEALAELQAMAQEQEEVAQLVSFINQQKRGIIR